MEKFKVTGMSCAACSARVEKAVSRVEGVKICEVNLLTGDMQVTGGARDDIISAVIGAGYGIEEDAKKEKGKSAANRNGERRATALRLIFSAALLIPLMYLSMGYTMWGFPLPDYFVKNPASVALLQLMLAAAVMVINKKFFISGARAVVKGAPNMDTLVALGSGASFVWSAYLVFIMISTPASEAGHYLHELYFESAAMILALITVGKLLESVAKGKTTTALEELMKLTPETVRVIRDGEEREISVSECAVGEEFFVRPGERIALDGVVISGESAVDESALTGESVPKEKTVGSPVYASSVNTSGAIKCKVTRVGEDTAMAKVIKIVSDAARSKAPIAKAADRVAAYFVPAVLIIAIITAIIWFFVNNSLGYALERGISVLVISCPCALGLATPVAIMVGSGIGAKRGILFKNAAALEALGRIKCVAIDKTGTLTTGKMTVGELVVLDGTEEELLSVAYTLEAESEHPLAAAVVEYARERGAREIDKTDFRALVGSGVFAKLGGEDSYGASYKYISTNFELSEYARTSYEKLADEGKTPLFFTRGARVVGIIAIYDALDAGSAPSVAELGAMGIKTVMLTGDNERTARRIGREAGVDEIIAEVLPQDKARVVEKLKAHGGVAMLGDGINDAPALATATVGVAIGDGTDIAIESADVVLIHSRISAFPDAVKLSRRTLSVIRANLFWAFVYNVLGIPLAAGAFIYLLNWELTPMFGAMAMSLSSFSVVMNALSLNVQNIFRKINKENKKMTKVFNVSGMMCPHCEAHVKSALESIEGVESALASHKDGTVTVTLSGEVSDSVIKAAITKAGYTV
ncbi:MAG: heavy metal translocating P-type ATPase [Clostridia bacterium]|nr:heavy metal translocating P-type ATPase [Clostridia bacterium]